MSALADWISLPPLPTGRRLHALMEMRQRAERIGFKALLHLLDDALAHEQRVLDLERAWASVTPEEQLEQVEHPALRDLDRRLDAALDALRDALERRLLTAPDDPDARALDDALDDDLERVTALPYIDQLDAVEALLDELTDALAPHVRALDLSPQVTHIADLHARYRAALADLSPDELTLEQLRDAHTLGQERLLRAVALILGHHPRPGGADATTRALLLEPVDLHRRATQHARLRGLPIDDVDPLTGHPLPSPS